jgi:hypothetical protein
MDVVSAFILLWVVIIFGVTAAYLHNLYAEKKKRKHELALARVRGVETAEQKDVATSQAKGKAYPRNMLGRARWKILAATIIVITIVAALAAVWYIQSTAPAEKSWRTLLWLNVRDDDTNGRAPHYTTEDFLVTGDEWRVGWSIHGQWDTFRIIVVDSYTENIIREINATGGLLTNNADDIDYFNIRGRFRLDLAVTPPNTTDLWEWVAYAQEYR